MAIHHCLLGSTGAVREHIGQDIYLLGQDIYLLGQDIYLLGQDNFLLGQDNIGKGFTLSLTLCLSRFAWCPTGHATSHLCVPTTLGGSI